MPADPYPWPFDTAVPIDKVALLCIDWQTDFCGPGGYVDRMGYDLELTRSGLPGTQKLLAHVRLCRDHNAVLPRLVERTGRQVGAGHERDRVVDHHVLRVQARIQRLNDQV